MVKEVRVPCKNFNRCGNTFGYSEWSYRMMEDRGHSRPEYCRECQKEHKRQKSGMAVAYFDVQPREGVDMSVVYPGWLGKLEHPERVHKVEERSLNFDPDDYGITVENVLEVYKWLNDPEHQVVVVVGETGSGKSTALPVFLMFPSKEIPSEYEDFNRNGQILVTQPRIIATAGIATYVGGTLLNATVGEGFDVGFMHSKDRNADWRNRCYYLTDGKLLNMLEWGDLGNISVVMIDEAHERTQNIDIILKLMKKNLPLYPDLNLIIASATIDPKKFRDYFGSDTAKIVRFKGKKQYGYDRHFAADESESLPFDEPWEAKANVIEAVGDKVIWLLEEIMSGRTPGDILAFVPGMRQIEGVIERVSSVRRDKRFKKKKIKVYPLHSEIPEGQKKFLAKENKNPNLIRVIVSTNIAEASVTINGLVYVVDSGLENQAQWDPDLNQVRIVPVAVSQANARQRWGRCGRNRPGEVFCLYTEDQFNGFLEYPVPDIERSPADQLVLRAKAAGLRDEEISSGWLDDPDGEEVDRAADVLAEKGAVDEEGYLTDYGELIRYFSYPTQIADLLMFADRFGCVIEVATVIPILKNGGRRRVLKWRYGWDAYTKREVSKIHKSIQAGCVDDVEFCLKVFSLWDKPPGYEEAEDIPALRKSWAKANFVDYQALDDINKERKDVLESLYGMRKTKGYRDIDFSLIDRVRMVLAYNFPEVAGDSFSDSLGGYSFQVRAEPQPGTVLTARVFVNPEWKKFPKGSKDNPASHLSVSRWMERCRRESQEEGRNKFANSRLYVDQAYPVGSIFSCVVKENVAAGEYRVEPVSLLSMRGEVAEEYREDVDEYDLLEEGEPEEIQPFVAVKKLQDVGYNFVIRDEGEEYDPETLVEAEVVCYEGLVNEEPSVVFEKVPEGDPFEVFMDTYGLEDEVVVEVTGHEIYEQDFKKSLVVTELVSGLEILMEPKDLAFTSYSDIVEQFQVGSKIEAELRSVDEEQKRVRLTVLPYVEERLREILEDEVDEDGWCGVKATVFGSILFDEEERSDKVLLILEESEVEGGCFFVVWTSGKVLPKPASEFKVGERYLVRFQYDTNWTFRTGLPNLPENLEYLMETEEDGLSWKAGKLQHRGRMEYQSLFEFKALDKSTPYHRSLDRLYHISNQIRVSSMVDLAWEEQMKAQFPEGTKLKDLKVLKVNDHGMDLEIEPGVVGFAPGSMVFEWLKDLKSGDTVKAAKVVGHSLQHQNLVLDLRVLENDHFYNYKAGQVVVGKITNAERFGLFVELEPGIDGMIHVSEIGSLTYLIGAKVGDKIRAVIIGVDVEDRRISLSTKRL